MIALCTEWPAADNVLLRAEFARAGIEIAEQQPPCARAVTPPSSSATWPAWLRLRAESMYERCDATGACAVAERLSSRDSEQRRAVVAHFVEVLRPDGASWASPQAPLRGPGRAAAPEAAPRAWSLALFARAGMGTLPIRGTAGMELSSGYALGGRWSLGLSAAAMRALGGTDIGRARVRLTHIPVVAGVEYTIAPALKVGAYAGVSALGVEGDDRPGISGQPGWAVLPRAELRANWLLLRTERLALVTGLRAGLPLVGAEIGVLTSKGYAAEGTVAGPDLSYVFGAVLR